MPTARRIKQTNQGGAATAAPLAIVVPEMVDARGNAPWTVRQIATDAGGANMVARQMTVPGANTNAARAVRVHEMMHARCTPPDLLVRGKEEGRTWDAMQASEDSRLNHLADAHGVAHLWDGVVPVGRAASMVRTLVRAGHDLAGASATSPEMAGADPSRAAFHRAACVCIALRKTQRWSEAWSEMGAAPADVRAAVIRAVREMENGYADAACTIKTAAHIDSILTPPEDEGNGTGDGPLPDEAQDHETREEEDAARDEMEAVQVHRPPLTERPAGNRSRRLRRTMDLGRLTRPSDILRMEAGRPFTRRQRVQGAVILLDSSGSMGYRHEDLAEMVKAAPGALVMIHASDGRDDAHLAVVAENGRCISADHLADIRAEIGGGNANDAGCVRRAAAIADRARVTGPRWWVTDEGFGDVHGSIGGTGTVEHCRRAARRTSFTITGHEDDIYA